MARHFENGVEAVENVNVTELRWQSFGWCGSQRYSPENHVPTSGE